MTFTSTASEASMIQVTEWGAQLPLRAQVLNKARDDAGKQAQTSLRDTNNVVRMVTAGSKGSFINISQVRARRLRRRCCV